MKKFLMDVWLTSRDGDGAHVHLNNLFVAKHQETGYCAPFSPFCVFVDF